MGKYKGQLLTAMAAATLAALVIALYCPAQSEFATAQGETATAFDYTLGVKPSELDDAQLAQVLDKAKAAGVTSVFTGAIWWYMDVSQRSYDWSDLDRLVEGAEARGMKVKVQLAGTPDWVHPDLVNTVPAHSDRVWYPPRGETELEHWSNFVYDLVSRYQGRVTQYQMWNEPNISEFWKPSPDPAEYAALLRAGYLSAKSAYPEATVVFGGLSRNDVGYLAAFYSEVKKYADAAENTYFFDVMDVHPYSSIPAATEDGLQEPISPDVTTPDAVFDGAYGEVDQNFLGVKKIKAAMNDHGDSEKPIYLGEYGFSTTDTWMEAVPDPQRALYLKRAFSLARDLPYVEGMRWYAYHPSSSTGPEWSILDTNLNETMTFRALRQVTGSESGGANVTLGTPGDCAISGTYTIIPAATDLGPTLDWELYVDGVKQGTYGQVPIDWDTTSVADGDHTLMVAAYTQEGSVWPSNVISVKVNNSGSPVTVDPPATHCITAPVIDSPPEGSRDNDGSFTLSGTAEPGVKVEVFEDAVSKGEATAGSDGRWSIPLSGVAEGSHTYTAKATDRAGNTSAESEAHTVIVDTTAPTVRRVMPAKNATDIAPGANVSAVFSEAMRAGSINGRTFKLYKKGSTTALTATVTYDPDTERATLDPKAKLEDEATYRAVVATAAKDLAGNALDQDASASGNQRKVWFFTTSSG